MPGFTRTVLVLAVAVAVAACSSSPDEGGVAASTPVPTPASTPTVADAVSLVDATGLDYTAAREELVAAGYDVRRAPVPSTDPANQVVGQEPAAGTQVRPGAIVTLQVSAGPSEEPSASEEGSFAEVFRTASDGIIRIEATTCDGSGVGTGFLLAPDLVATVAHVVDNGVTIALIAENQTTTGEVVGFDLQRELALLRADDPFPGHVFTFQQEEAEVGTAIAAIGFPRGGPLSLSQGTVSGLGRTLTIAEIDVELEGLLQTDTAINPGNSGGPLVDAAGEVVGLVEASYRDAAGLAYAISGPRAKVTLQGWQARPEPPPQADCAEPLGPTEGDNTVASDVDHPEVPALLATFQAYTDGINRGEYEVAYGQLTPAYQSRIPFEEFRGGAVSSYVFDLRVRSITPTADGLASEVTFTSIQSPEYGRDGQDCSLWALTYDMRLSEGRWLIDRSTGSADPC